MTQTQNGFEQHLPESLPDPLPESLPELEPLPAAVSAARDAMEQVRDLLFGETRRTTEQHLRAIDEKIEALRADLLARMGDLECRLVELSRETEQTQAASVNAIGSGLAQLGATIQNMNLRQKGG